MNQDRKDTQDSLERRAVSVIVEVLDPVDLQELRAVPESEVPRDTGGAMANGEKMEMMVWMGSMENRE